MVFLFLTCFISFSIGNERSFHGTCFIEDLSAQTDRSLQSRSEN